MLRNRIIVILHDLLMIPLAWLGAYWLRFNLEAIPPSFLERAITVLPWLFLAQAIVYHYFGLYRGVWRFASMPDLIRIIKAVAVATVLTAIGVFLYYTMHYVPRSIFLLYGLLLIALLGGSRLAFRWLKDVGKLFHAHQRVLIVGAGSKADGIIRNLLSDKRYKPCVLVDDNIAHQGRELHGIRVQGFSKNIPTLVQRYKIDFIIIAIPSASPLTLRNIVGYCERANVAFQILPNLVELSTLRPVHIEDLLGREPVSLDWPAIESGLKDKTILVTGGGGSIGAELCRQIIKLSPKKLIVIENNEFNLYSLTQELNSKLDAHLADITDPIAIDHIMSHYKPDIIFHAAAYKHVPLLESHLRMAVRNNILGTQIVAKAAVKYNTKTFVFISTDKAVNPTNVLGATKRIAEIACQYLNNPITHFLTVRFGNVLGSAGSVVPLFRKQLEEGGPITVTHPDITRFFMTIPEACQLILQATILAKGGEIFVLDMGEPIKIQYLAEQLIRLSGRLPGKDIAIHYTGLRPGEKLYEELFYQQETLTPTPHPKILQARYNAHDWAQLETALEKFSTACDTYNDIALRKIILELVPEYTQKI
ncbi:MAG: polysaccharide biosynthesis protein [Gammaproteobacteria bacterium]